MVTDCSLLKRLVSFAVSAFALASELTAVVTWTFWLCVCDQGIAKVLLDTVWVAGSRSAQFSIVGVKAECGVHIPVCLLPMMHKCWLLSFAGGEGRGFLPFACHNPLPRLRTGVQCLRVSPICCCFLKRSHGISGVRGVCWAWLLQPDGLLSGTDEPISHLCLL